MCEEYCDSGAKAADDASMTYAAAVDCVHTFHMMTIKHLGFLDISDEHVMHIVKLQFDRIIKALSTEPTEADLLEMAVNEATRNVLFEEPGPDEL